MVHWFSTRERGRVVSFWNVGHNVGGGLVATFAVLGVSLFHDWGAKFYVNAAIAATVAVVVFFLMRDTPKAYGLPPVEEYKNDYPPHYGGGEERAFTYREIFVEHVLTNKYRSAIAGSGVGWIADTFGWTGVFVTMVACCLLTIAFSAMTLGHKAESAAR